jgi:branched-chain amino acid transport system ATP-binding protein
MTDLAVTGLCAGYGDSLVLKNVSFSIKAGGTAAIFGRNGSGKSTILRAIDGLVRCSGSVLFGGVSIANMPTESIAALGIAHVPQGRGTFTGLTVEQNLRLGGGALKRRLAAIELQRVYELLPQLAPRRHQLAGTLSGGEQQMLAIGRALMSRPKLVLMDEPSFGLAPKIVASLFETLSELRELDCCSLLLAEQNPQLAIGFADVAHLLEDGRIALSTSPDDPELIERLRRSHLAIR